VVWGQEYESLKKWSDLMPTNVTVTMIGEPDFASMGMDVCVRRRFRKLSTAQSRLPLSYFLILSLSLHNP